MRDGLALRKVLRRAKGEGAGVPASLASCTLGTSPLDVLFVGVDIMDIRSAAGSGAVFCTGDRGLSMVRRMSSCHSLALSVGLRTMPSRSWGAQTASVICSADVEGGMDDALYERVSLGETGCSRITAAMDADAGASRLGGAGVAVLPSQAILTEDMSGVGGARMVSVRPDCKCGDPSRDRLLKSDAEDVDVFIGISLTHLPRRPGLSVLEPASGVVPSV